MKKNVLLGSTLVILTCCLLYLVWLEKSNATKPQRPPSYLIPIVAKKFVFKITRLVSTFLGTLTLPAKVDNVAAVILITGSGPQDRNEEVFRTQDPFWLSLIISHATGFAVLRYDDRGIGQSTGNFMTATSLDFAADAESAVAYLKTRKEINGDKIGLVGHSEGSLVAAIAASHLKEVSFVISLAGPGVTCIDVMHLQAELIARAGGVDETAILTMSKTNRETATILRRSLDTTELRTSLTAYAQGHWQNYPQQQMLPAGQTKEEFFKNQINAMCTPWYQFLYKTDPATYFEKLACPVLVLNGSKDLRLFQKR